MSNSLLLLAAVFAILGFPLLLDWLSGGFPIFWTIPGAALVQAYGSAAACLWGAWLFKGEPK